MPLHLALAFEPEVRDDTARLALVAADSGPDLRGFVLCAGTVVAGEFVSDNRDS